MKRAILITNLLSLSLVTTAQIAVLAAADSVELKGPIPTQSTAPTPASQPAEPIGGMSAPGADAMMTPDMLMVLPTNPTQQAPKPLKDLIGPALKLEVDRSDITFDTLKGLLITVTNDTNRPVVIDGDKAKAMIGDKEYQCAPVSAIQQAIVPPHTKNSKFEELLKKALPAAVTVGAVPTIRDFKESKKPVLERYGRDELRRKVEFSRFGRRVLWTNVKVQGILYFQTDADLKGAKIVIPATTLFDSTDTGVLTSTP